MTLPDLDAAVVEARNALVDHLLDLKAHGNSTACLAKDGGTGERIEAYEAALAARAAADRPQPLTAEEAETIYHRQWIKGQSMEAHTAGVRDILDACRARDLKLIEALYRQDQSPQQTVAHIAFMDAIRDAFLPPNPLTRR